MKKKYYFALAVLATAMLTSCLKEPLIDEPTPLGENDIAFVLGGTSTKAMESASMKATGVTIPMGVDDQGNGLLLEETIEELNPNPATKGTPAYTVNVGTLLAYKQMGVHANPAGGFGNATGDAVFDVMSEMVQHDKNNADLGNGWRYRKGYDINPWPDEDTKIDFYLRLPAEMGGVTNLAYSNQQTSFHLDLSSLATAEDQQDLLFGYTSISKSDHDGYYPNGAPVEMHHALTGVKFRVGSDNKGGTKTIITGVKFSGLYASGDCAIASTGGVAWSNRGTKTATFSQGFDNTAYSEMGVEGGTKPLDNSIDLSGEDSQFAGTTLVNAAADKQLNDENASLTFWFIPQQLTSDVKLEITFRVKTPDTPNGTEITHKVDFGDLVRTQTKNDDGTITYGDYPTWEAGQIRTYTLNPKDVDVDIFDSMNGVVKSNLRVTNTGNVDEYVRMMLIGNWYGWLPGQDPETEEPNILVGYTTDDITNETMVEAWYRKSTKYSKGFDDSFAGGEPSSENNTWVEGTGSYFYYPNVIGAGDKLPTTEALFQFYDLSKTVTGSESLVPVIWVPQGGVRVQAVGVHLVMECVIQAISTTKPDGTPYASCWEAWSAATGETIAPK